MKQKANPLESYEDWKAIEQLEHDAQLDYLRNRVEIQRQLISALSKLERAKKQEEEERLHNLYKKKLEEKRQQADRLQEICRDSMATDRQSKRKRRPQMHSQLQPPDRNKAVYRPPVRPPPPRVPQSDSDLSEREEEEEQNQDQQQQRGTKTASSHQRSFHSKPSASASRASGSEHTRIQLEGREETLVRIDDAKQVAEDEGQEQIESDHAHEGENDTQRLNVELLPLYQAYLHQQFGTQVANSFLHPKFDKPDMSKRRTSVSIKKQRPNGISSQTTFIQSLSPLLREKCRVGGVATVWDIMARRTQKRLLRADAQIPQGLKDAYRAFMLEQLARGKIPPARSFCERNDLPELPRLLDDSALRETRSYRRVVEAMYRVAKESEDRSRLLVEADLKREVAAHSGDDSPNDAAPQSAERTSQTRTRPTPNTASVREYFDPRLCDSSQSVRAGKQSARFADDANVETTKMGGNRVDLLKLSEEDAFNEARDMLGTAAAGRSPYQSDSSRLRFATTQDLHIPLRKYSFNLAKSKQDGAHSPPKPAESGSPKAPVEAHTSLSSRSSSKSKHGSARGESPRQTSLSVPRWPALRLNELADRARIVLPTGSVMELHSDSGAATGVSASLSSPSPRAGKLPPFSHGSPQFWKLDASHITTP